MEYALKQRIVGAIVLVVAAVIVVPFILPGPSSEGVIIRTDVPRAVDASPPKPRLATEAAAREPYVERSPPRPTNNSGRAPFKARPPAAQSTEKPISNRTANRAPTVAPLPATTGDGWVVQVGSFTSDRNAIGLRDRMRDLGFPAFVRTVERGAKQMTRVLVGPIETKAAAQDLAVELDDKNLPTRLLRYP